MPAHHSAAPLDIEIGSNVQCRDGRTGRVIKLVVAPGRKLVTHIVVERGVLNHHDVAVPVAHVAGVEGDTVVLDLSSDELNALPAYAEIDYAIPDAYWVAQHGYPPDDTLVDLGRYTPDDGLLAPAWPVLWIQGHTHAGVPPQETPVDRYTRVTGREGPMGRLDHVLLDPDTGDVRALALRKGHLLTKDVIVPAGWVERVGEDEIVIDADRTMLERLPEYRPDHPEDLMTPDTALASSTRKRQETKADSGHGQKHRRSGGSHRHKAQEAARDRGGKENTSA